MKVCIHVNTISTGAGEQCLFCGQFLKEDVLSSDVMFDEENQEYED